MTEEEKKEATINRIRDLINLQKLLCDSFSESEFNVFVFGSYPTVRYVPGESDADIAVYANDLETYKKIALIIEEFFEERDISLDLFFIDTSNPAPFFLAPLHAQIQLTDYFPGELKLFEQKCANELAKIKRNIA